LGGAALSTLLVSSTQRTNQLGEGGFTLLELMIVVAIVGILAAIAFTTYSAQVQKARRTDARTAVLDLAGREERYFSVNNSYSTTAADVGYGGAFPQVVGSGYYLLSITIAAVGAPPSYNIIATAVPPQTADTSCASFSINQLGQQSSKDSGGADSTAVCWAN
jgi:type IV pilus assembly protein PilE